MKWYYLNSTLLVNGAMYEIFRTGVFTNPYYQSSDTRVFIILIQSGVKC